MTFDEYIGQFEFIQPVVIACKRCGHDYMLIKGFSKAEALKLPACCAYCGYELAKTPDGHVKGMH